MKKIDSLKNIIELNGNFKTAINLYLSLNKPEKVLSYIPTKSSVSFMGDYLNSVLNNKEQSTLLVGPYGKGKSHLLLVLLAVLSMDRNLENENVIEGLIENVKKTDEVGEKVADLIKEVWSKKRFLPVLITDTTGDLNQAFLYGLNDALKRENMSDLIPDTYYSIALERLNDWEENYTNTFLAFEKEIGKSNITISDLKAGLKMYSKDSLKLFKMVYPKVTAGSEFNPLAVSDVLPLFKSTSEKLVEEYGYSGIYIVFDEFSKFIESQDGTAAGSNMKLLQDICELSTESQNSQIFFTMVAHKSIKEYGKYLSQDIINSFTGIEGRIIEKYFVTSSKNNYELIRNAIIKDDKAIKDIPHFEKYLGEETFERFFNLPAFKSNFVENEFRNIIFYGCYPLNPIASYLLLNVSEKVAQNERTLFTFISNDEPHSMARFIAEHTSEDEWSIGADLIYDYFASLFKKEVTNEYVHNIWLSAEYALSKCDNLDQKKLIKALAIILIVNKEDEIPATGTYLKLAVNASEADLALDELKKNEFVQIMHSTGAYVFKTKAGSELRAEIRRRSELKGNNVNYSNALLKATGKYYVIPRKYNVNTSMTRYFVNEYMEVDDFLNINSAEVLFDDDVLDGKVLTLYSFTGIKQEKVKKHLEELGDKRIVVVCPKKGLKAQKQLKEFEIITELRDDQSFTNNNEILKKELPLLVDDLTLELEHLVTEIYEDDLDTRVLFYDGNKVHNAKVGNEEIAVNECCTNLYFKTPIINNEMVNRAVISTGQTKKARLNIIETILLHEDDENYYAGSNQEATIYRSLFTVTGIRDNKVRPDIMNIINEINSYVDSCSDTKVSFSNLISKLIAEPYGMRIGVIPFFVARVLADRREDIIIYYANKEMQITAEVVIGMCDNPEDYAVFVSKADLQKEKYINELNRLFQVEDNRNLTSNRIKDIFICMQRWFRGLEQASRNLVNVEQYIEDEKTISDMKSLKTVLQRVDFNPFESLFVDLPKAFKLESLEDTYKQIDKCVTAYDDYFDWIIDQTIKGIYKTWDAKTNIKLYHILTEWYENQSKRSKQGLYDGRMTNFMSCIQSLDSYKDNDYIAKKIAKAVTDVYMEDWNSGTLEEFIESLANLKLEIESVGEGTSEDEYELTFRGKNGNLISKVYTHASEGSGSVLRNILEDTLEEYDDLSVNDRVSILLEMIEKIIK